MYSIIYIDNGVLESISTPSFSRAITIADALYLSGYSVRLWKGTQLV